jgi:SAM-dependent methyltransferase
MSSLKSALKRLARSVLPEPVMRIVQRARGRTDFAPSVGTVQFGELRRLRPISHDYGYSRGRPVDRYYIENFLRAESRHITGNVLEIGENTYTRNFGHDVVKSDVLHVNEGVEGATYVDDLTDGPTLPSNHFDCVILCQTLHLIYDMKAALQTIYRILKPGGVLLTTVPGITQISDEEWNDSWYWSLTTNSANRLFKDVFPPALVDVNGFGNVLAATSFLYGLSDHELTTKELDFVDPEYPVVVTIRATTAHEGLQVPMETRWDYAGVEQFAYDEETSYAKGIEFLDGHGQIEDWGCGTAFAKRFVKQSEYVGVDGSRSEFCDVVADLQTYRSDTACLFMRHVLEHNWGWRSILRNAVASFRERMVLIIFTPFEDSERKLLEENGVPDLALNKDEILSYFAGLSVTEETIRSQTQYGEETLFYVERKTSA